MDLSNLKPAKGSTHSKKRIARGQGSGRGRTATRGHKGAQSRSGYSRRFGFEGGQMPIQRRIPKFGFNNINRKVFQVFNLDRLQYISEKLKVKNIDPDILYQNNIIGKTDLIKIIGRGKLEVKIDVKAHAFSETAKKAIEEKGGKTEQI